MKKLSLAFAATAAILTLGTFAGAANAQDRGVHAFIQAPLVTVQFGQRDVQPAPHFVPGFQPVRGDFERRDFDRRDGRRDDRRFESRRDHRDHRAQRFAPTRFDRDGDGVPNRYDRNPGNPYRR